MGALAVLIDTDVLLDFLVDRGAFTKNAKVIIQKLHERKINSYLAPHSITNIFYILRKVYSASERKQRLMDLCRFISVVQIGHDTIIKALLNNDFNDIEDCLQAECARVINADYILTRNVKDYANSSVPAILPEKFLKLLRA